MKCQSVQKEFSAYQDGELEPQEHEEVRRHLESCQSCQEQYEKLEQIWQTLGKLEEIRPDPWFYPQLIRKINEPPERGRWQNVQRLFQLLRTPVFASILVAIGIVTGIYLGNIMARHDFLSFQPTQPTYSQEALLDSLKAFDPAPPGTLAHGYLQMANYNEDGSR